MIVSRGISKIRQQIRLSPILFSSLISPPSVHVFVYISSISLSSAFSSSLYLIFNQKKKKHLQQSADHLENAIALVPSSALDASTGLQFGSRD